MGRWGGGGMGSVGSVGGVGGGGRGGGVWEALGSEQDVLSFEIQVSGSKAHT